MSSRPSIRSRFGSRAGTARAMRQQVARASLTRALRGPFPRQAISTRAFRAAAGEKKGLDTAVGGLIVNTTNTNESCNVLNLIQSGAASWNRVGRKVILKSLRLKGYAAFTQAFNNTTGGTKNNLLRITIVWDKQPSGGAIPAFDQVFGITTQAGTEVTSDIFNPPRYDNMDRFRVLFDEVIKPDAEGFMGSGTAPGTVQNIFIDKYLKLGLLESNYSSNTSPMTIADISSGGLYIYFRALSNDSQALVNFGGSTRLRYSD